MANEPVNPQNDSNPPPVNPGGIGQPTPTESPTDAPSAPENGPDTSPVDPAREGEEDQPNPPPTAPETPETTDKGITREEFRKWYREERDSEQEPSPDTGRDLNVGSEQTEGDTGDSGTSSGDTGTETAVQPKTRVYGFRGRGSRRYRS